MIAELDLKRCFENEKHALSSEIDIDIYEHFFFNPRCQLESALNCLRQPKSIADCSTEIYTNIAKKSIDVYECLLKLKDAQSALTETCRIWKSEHGYYEWIQPNTTQYADMIKDSKLIINIVKKQARVLKNSKRRLRYALSRLQFNL